jgi:hypothetical protein
MSSPIGGFYMSAQRRAKATQLEHATQVHLILDLVISVADNVLVEHSFEVIAGKPIEWSNKEVLINTMATVMDSGLIGIECDLTIKALGYIGKQQVNVDLGESITTLVAGHEQVKLTIATSCSDQKP